MIQAELKQLKEKLNDPLNKGFIWVSVSPWGAMFILEMDNSSLMVYVQQLEEKKLRDRKSYRNKKAKTENESGQ